MSENSQTTKFFPSKITCYTVHNSKKYIIEIFINNMRIKHTCHCRQLKQLNKWLQLHPTTCQRWWSSSYQCLFALKETPVLLVHPCINLHRRIQYCVCLCYDDRTLKYITSCSKGALHVHVNFHSNKYPIACVHAIHVHVYMYAIHV